MTTLKAPRTLKDLGRLSQTAWLTAFCHHTCGADWDLHRPVSNWLIGQVGPPPFAPDLSFMTRHGIAARAKWFDDRAAHCLDGCRAAGRSTEIWVLGAGFDSRWEWILPRYADTVSAYREFDFPDLLSVKTEVLETSPWRDLWRRVDREPGEIPGCFGSAPQTGKTVHALVIIEGLIDYFSEDQKRAVFEAIRRRVDHAVVLIDCQNAFSLRLNNRRAQRSTGSGDVTFTWAPRRPVDFFKNLGGYEIRAVHPLVPDLVRRRSRLLGLLPMPRPIREAYALMDLRTGPVPTPALPCRGVDGP